MASNYSFGEGEDPKMVDLRDLFSSLSCVPSFVTRSAEKILGLERLNIAYAKIARAREMGNLETFFALSTRYLNLRYILSQEELANIPETGPTVVVANHPHGMADGLMFGDILTRRRSDVRLIVNEQLTLCKELEPWVIKVDVYESGDSRRKNISGIRQMLAWLKKGGCIGIFPAGSASSFSLKDRQVTDDPWNTNFAALVRKTKATVVPLFFPGRNSLLFQGVSMVNRAARVMLLPREVGRDGKKEHKVLIGKPIPSGLLSQFGSDEALVAHLRLRTYLLGQYYQKKKKPFAQKEFIGKEVTVPQQPIIDPVPVDLLAKDISQIPDEQCLVNRNNWRVFYATAAQIPSLLKEIGRLREITFRGVGEGSGSSCDLDKYDQHYHHLFLWDDSKKCIAGAYRMGLTDRILATLGKEGLYNNQFFFFDDAALSKISPGLEMGRAFITAEYQRRPLSLGLIWEGIGQFIARFPHYRYLFGTVSTSGAYTTLSHSLILSFLKAHAMDEELAALIKAKKPPTLSKLRGSEDRILPLGLADAQDLSNVVSDIESDGKGIPVLLRQYLKLNGKILAFGLDKDFGNVIDSLILVDIYKSPERSLRRYLGDDATDKIKNFIEPS